MHSARKAHVDVLQLLLDAKARLDLRDDLGRSALQLAPPGHAQSLVLRAEQTNLQRLLPLDLPTGVLTIICGYHLELR